VERNVTLNYSSTLEGSVLTLTCENDTSTDEQTLSVTCDSSGNWIPDPAQFTCSEFTTVPSGTEILIHSSPRSNSGKRIFFTLPPGPTIVGIMYAPYKYLWCTTEIFVVCGDPEGIIIFSQMQEPQV
jgi:hypothetical protein